jgi:hypothetical protein
MSDPEIDAMSAIASALTDLDEDAQERVLRWAAARHGVTTTPTQSPSPAGKLDGALATGTRVPLGIFMKRRFPNQHATAAAILTWAKRHDGKNSLKPGEMETYWKKVLKKPGNSAQICQNAEKQGWLDNVGGGAYAVTGHGESMVDKLPVADDE